MLTNVGGFMSCATMLHRNIFEAQGVNQFHNDLIQCYALLAEDMGWEGVYASLVKTATGTVENQEILTAARKHLSEIKKLRQYDDLPN